MPVRMPDMFDKCFGKLLSSSINLLHSLALSSNTEFNSEITAYLMEINTAQIATINAIADICSLHLKEFSDSSMQFE